MCPATAAASGALTSQPGKIESIGASKRRSRKVLQWLIVIGGLENVYEKSAPHIDGEAACGTLGSPFNRIISIPVDKCLGRRPFRQVSI